MDKKTEKFIQKMASDNKKKSLDEYNKKIIFKNTKHRDSKSISQALEDDLERNRFFNDMKRRDF